MTVEYDDPGYRYVRSPLSEPDWRRLPGWRDVTEADWRSAQWQRAHSVKNPGQSPTVGADRFAYAACTVPNLKNKTLKQAKKVLRRANCGLGKVKPKGQKLGAVKKQSPKPGKELPPGAKVNVKLG